MLDGLPAQGHQPGGDGLSARQRASLGQVQCVACQQVWPQWRDVESEYPNLVCEQCHREVDIADLKDKQFLTCKACKHTIDVSDCWNRLTDSHEVYSQAIENTVHGKTEEALPQLVEHMRLMQRHLDMP